MNQNHKTQDLHHTTFGILHASYTNMYRQYLQENMYTIYDEPAFT